MSVSESEFAAELVAADGTRHALAGEMRIGRSSDCEITIEDAKVSRKHAVFRVEGETVTVEDLGSANGTLVNGQRIAGATTLAHGDALEFEKHRYSLQIAGQELPEDDATIVNPPADDDMTVVNAPEPPPPPPPPPVSPDLPGAWVDDPGMGEHTQVMGDLSSGPSAASVDRLSDQAHLILLRADGSAAEASELEPSDSADPDIWEIGREDSCEVTLTDPSVSGRHAQLVHDGGRWRIVNLVSANGIFVNGEKRLSAFLSEDDQIQLGNATLVFKAPAGAAAAARPAAAASAQAGGTGAGGSKKGSSKLLLIVGGVVVILAVAAAAVQLL